MTAYIASSGPPGSPWPSQQVRTCICAPAAQQRFAAEPCSTAQVQSSDKCSGRSSSRPQRGRPGRHSPLRPLLLAMVLLSLAFPPPVLGRRLVTLGRRLAADRSSESTTAAQQPCVQCNSCMTRGCYNICSNNCRPNIGSTFASTGASFPGGLGGYDPGQCKQDGLDIADDIAQQACKGAQAMCQSGIKMQAYVQEKPVSASQCAAQANAACQKGALASSQTPCGANLYFGFRSCSGRQFNDLYGSYVSQGCSAATFRF